MRTIPQSLASTPSRGAHRCGLTRRATAIRQAGGALEDVQATLEFLIDRRKMLTELDSQIQQIIEEDDELEADVDEAADVFLAAERAVKWCQARTKTLQPPSSSAAAATSSGSLTTKLSKLTLPSFSGEYTHNGFPSGSKLQHWLTANVT